MTPVSPLPVEFKMPTFVHFRFSSRVPEVPINRTKGYESRLILYQTVSKRSRCISGTRYAPEVVLCNIARVLRRINLNFKNLALVIFFSTNWYTYCDLPNNNAGEVTKYDRHHLMVIFGADPSRNSFMNFRT